MDPQDAKINLPEIGRQMIRYKSSPAKLDELQLRLAAWYSFYAEKMINLELAEATFWEENKNFQADKPKSDPMVRALWRISKNGHQMLETERTLKTIHILISSLKASISRQSNELRNLPK